MRRTTMTTAAALLGVLALSGCVPGPPAPDREVFSGATTAIDAESFEGREIDYVSFVDSDAEESSARALIARFEQETGASVNLQLVPYANLEQSLNARLSGSDVPDVARVASNQLPSFTDQTVDLRTFFGEEYADEFLPGVASTVEGADGEMWAVPSDLTMNGLFVNTDLFEQAGVPLPTADDPWTWDRMIADAEAVQAATGSEFAFAMDKTGHRASGVLSAFGTTMIGADGENALDPAIAEQVIGRFADLMADDRMSKDFWLATGSRYAGANEIFLAGSAPVYLSGNWQVSQFADAADFDWAVVPNICELECGGFPGVKVMTTFQRGGDADLAAYFVRWMNDREQQAEMDAGANWLPTRVDLTEEGVDYELRADDMDVFLAEVPVTPEVTYASAAVAAFNPASLEFVDVLARVVAGEYDAAEAATRLDAEIDGLTGEAP